MYEIEQLHSGDYEQAMDFINMVFSMESGPTNFPVMLPAYYKSDEAHMSCHYAIREDGQIRAMLGIYPGGLQVADTTLRVAKVGAVSTHPNHQGRGMMRTLMEYSNHLIRQHNYHLAVLGGLRHRYLRFGYEKCGMKLSFSFHTDSLRKYVPADDSLWLERYSGDPELVIDRLKQMHDAQIIHAIRDARNFADYCKNWHGQLYIAWVGTEMAGYLISNAAGSHVYEIVANEDLAAVDMIAAFAKDNRNEFYRVDLPALDRPLLHGLGELCEEIVLKPANSWQVLDWETVTGSLLRAKNHISRLPQGELVLTISGYGHMRVSVGENGVHTVRTEQQGELELTPTDMMRVLFGPASPQITVGVQTASTLAADKIALLQSWGPLPLYLAIPDTA